LEVFFSSANATMRRPGQQINFSLVLKPPNFRAWRRSARPCQEHARPLFTLAGVIILFGNTTASSSVLAKKRCYMRERNLILTALAALTLLWTNGCTTMRQTDPPRTATEQLLLSTAADRAVEDVTLAQFANKKVFLDPAYFDSYDSKYALGAIRDALSRAGALLMADSKASEITIEARSGALSTDDRTYLLGLPALGIPIPLAGTVTTPEIALYKSSKQYSTAKFALLAYTTQSRGHVFSSGSMVGKAYNNYFNIIFVPLHRTDVPEIKKKKTR
jgi:hypothetical protein